MRNSGTARPKDGSAELVSYRVRSVRGGATSPSGSAVNSRHAVSGSRAGTP